MAIEASTGRQLGRYHRFVRVTPPPARHEANNAMNGAGANNDHAGPGGGGEGSTNPMTTALPLPAVMRELQSWMSALKLVQGATDEAGFAERGNFRCARQGCTTVLDWIGCFF